MEKSNLEVMMKFIVNPGHLAMIMTLLRENSKTIQYEAFHVFKIFVANPSKPPQIIEVFVKNKDKLVMYLSNFQNDRYARNPNPSAERLVNMRFAYAERNTETLASILDRDEAQFKEEKMMLIREISGL